MQKWDFETYQNAFESSRSYQNFSRPTFFEVPFTTPTCDLTYIGKKRNIEYSRTSRKRPPKMEYLKVAYTSFLWTERVQKMGQCDVFVK